MLDADGATAIADLEQLEKAMDKLTKDHVRTYMCLCTVASYPGLLTPACDAWNRNMPLSRWSRSQTIAVKRVF